MHRWALFIVASDRIRAIMPVCREGVSKPATAPKGMGESPDRKLLKIPQFDGSPLLQERDSAESTKPASTMDTKNSRRRR